MRGPGKWTQWSGLRALTQPVDAQPLLLHLLISFPSPLTPLPPSFCSSTVMLNVVLPSARTDNGLPPLPLPLLLLKLTRVMREKGRNSAWPPHTLPARLPARHWSREPA